MCINLETQHRQKQKMGFFTLITCKLIIRKKLVKNQNLNKKSSSLCYIIASKSQLEISVLQRTIEKGKNSDIKGKR